MSDKKPRAGRVRLTDVADLAGVSPTAVSFVLNNRPDARLSEDTRKRVLDAAKELNYRVNITARGLATRRTHTIGFVSDEIASTEFAGGLISGSQQVASAHGMHLFVVETAGKAESSQATVEALLDREVEGVIYGVMSAREVQPPPALDELPTVLMNCFTEADEYPTVLADEEHGGYLATQVLIEAGHRKIGLINGRFEGRGMWASAQRLLGYKRALSDAGIEFDEELVLYSNWQPDGGYEQTLHILGTENPPTALFCANDRMAMGAYEAARALGLNIPNDVSIVGYDNQPMSGYFTPPLTTVDLPHEEIGKVACDLLQRIIARKEGIAPGRTLVQGAVVDRSSVSAPAKQISK